MRIEKGSRLVFIGDSITDCNRVKPVACGKGNLGDGFVNLVNAFLNTSYPDYYIRVFNMGISGNTVRDLDNRWQSDALDLNPDWLIIMIGINDVWRQFDSPIQTEEHVHLNEYRDTLERLIVKSSKQVKRIVLMTPFFIEHRVDDPMRAKMDEYGLVVKQLAKEYDLLLVDTQKVINDHLQHVHSSALAWDRVHPDTTGHMLLARAFLNVIDFKFIH
ncbi:SGNH/GDSL hydrolase family protein [Haloplasma contractile]|uniref:Acyl-CoA thioesterase I protein n=1 Tax=Haloplasma contractile SSD-17B TaxID=1033810 RepID=U2E9N3_9MOLU|nr:SGNH/GDSL hydrolase family protein [Haloplasma contractile]ERJ11848.1 acyl-CoA thioesterase I protein [Haloplasma contractile SSD-17B]